MPKIKIFYTERELEWEQRKLECILGGMLAIGVLLFGVISVAKIIYDAGVGI